MEAISLDAHDFAVDLADVGINSKSGFAKAINTVSWRGIGCGEISPVDGTKLRIGTFIAASFRGDPYQMFL